jgi:hypothetical protein
MGASCPLLARQILLVVWKLDWHASDTPLVRSSWSCQEIIQLTVLWLTTTPSLLFSQCDAEKAHCAILQHELFFRILKACTTLLLAGQPSELIAQLHGVLMEVREVSHLIFLITNRFFFFIVPKMKHHWCL